MTGRRVRRRAREEVTRRRIGLVKDDGPTGQRGSDQWCIAKTGGGYTQRGVAKGLKVPCLFMITEVSIRCQKNQEVGIRCILAYTPQYTTGSDPLALLQAN